MGVPTVERLVFTQAPDGLDLTGVAFEATGGDLVVLSHGGIARFCDRAYVEIGRALAGRGVAVLSGDTRAHDIAALGMVDGGPTGIGGAFELFADSVGDTATWLRHGRGTAPGRLIAAGHSIGGSRTVLAVSQGAPADAMVLLSPAVRWPDNAERIALARDRIAEGLGDRLMPPHPDGPAFNLISANTLAQRADVIEPVFVAPGGGWDKIDVPTLVLFGGDEPDIDQDLSTLAAGWASAHPLTCRTIDGTGHDFAGAEAAVADAVTTWLFGREIAAEQEPDSGR
jgi:dienelactone hydrolase